VTASHYQDVVVPFRQQQPDYQRRWRLGRKLREIRETMMPTGGVMLSSLRALLGRAEDLSKSADRYSNRVNESRHRLGALRHAQDGARIARLAEISHEIRG